MMLSTAQIIGYSNIAFGTSGARGLVSDFTDDVCAAFATNFITVMQRNYSFNRVAIGIDNRPSSQHMAFAVAGVVNALGLEVDYYGVLPTPALAYQALKDMQPAIMITGSHIPFDRNGMKFYRPDGEINKADENAILTLCVALPSFSVREFKVSTKAAQSYLERYLNLYPVGSLLGKHIGIYEHSSSGRDLYYSLFETLGAKVTRLERSNSFVPIDTEAVSESDKLKARNWSLQYKFDAIFSTDGDGDRPLIADETGEWLRGDIVGLLCAKALHIEALAVPVNCNTAIEKSGHFTKVVRTCIGSPFVISAFSDFTKQISYAGFEANGGFLLGSDVVVSGRLLKALPTRDALLPGLVLLASIGSKKLSTMVNSLPRRFTASDRIQQVPTHLSKALLAEGLLSPNKLLNQLGLSTREIQSLDQTDGLRILFADDDIIHLRPSGNAPELRCYAESTGQASAEALVQTVLRALKVLIR
jgi:phosphomannomutase